jgi:hypothetical protein
MGLSQACQLLSQDTIFACEESYGTYLEVVHRTASNKNQQTYSSIARVEVLKTKYRTIYFGNIEIVFFNVIDLGVQLELTQLDWYVAHKITSGVPLYGGR